jgi:hypothetical protein
MTTTLGLTLLLSALVAQGGRTITAEDLAAAKVLYASGAYEDALNKLSPVTADVAADGVGQVRALCLLALGRSDEAKQSLEDLVTRRPLYKMSEAEVSPQVIAMFHDIRKRLLPGAAKDLYVVAKANFDRQRYNLSTPQFKDLLAMINDEDMAEHASSLADLKTLGEGFLRLGEMEIAAAAKAAASAPPPPVPAEPIDPNRVYGETDTGVKAPVELARPMPMWHPPNSVAERTGYRGVLRIVIDEQGKVEVASLVKSVTEQYDPLLIAATAQWKFRPATRDGRPVKYQKLIEIVLAPKQPLLGSR